MKEFPDEEGHYSNGAVASHSRICSQIGRDILEQHGGSAVDAAIATLVALGTVQFQSSGIFGDNFWTIYERQTGKSYCILARSMAPKGSHSTMFVNNQLGATEGGLSIAVPGEVLGMWEAHQRFGKLPWKQLFEPSILLAEQGFPAEPHTVAAIENKESTGVFDRWPLLRDLVTNPETGTWYKPGEIIRRPLLARTLKRIADGGALEFYSQTLADDMIEEIYLAGGIMTKEDLKGYSVQVTEPLQQTIHDQLTVLTPGLPSGGPVLQYIMNILSGYQMTSSDVSTNERTVLTYHRLTEAFKHAFAARSRMGSIEGEDHEFEDAMNQLVKDMMSPKQGEAIREIIKDDTTLHWKNYCPEFDVTNSHGTSHVSVIAANGDAVSVTSTVNLSFGSKVVGHKTGLVYNNLMDDFSTPGLVNHFGVSPSPSNFIKPGKRPMSAMCPAIFVDQKGQPVLIAGARGGTKILTSTSIVAAMTLWLGRGIKSAIDSPRVHHQVLPDTLLVKNSPQWLIDGLYLKGHMNIECQERLGGPNGIYISSSGLITAYAPGGSIDGY